ncbi:MAG: hypothetical protein DHS20C21_14090 [Gemmatimonadota bacterium]|nr:MAG: hypothetical protein DHS20C21_14090 [Gemmatimonadota bacterium]
MAKTDGKGKDAAKPKGLGRLRRAKKGEASVDEAGADELRSDETESVDPDPAEGDGAAPDDAPVPEETEVERLQRELAEAQAEVAEAADRTLRTLAEFDNFRRRSFRERQGAEEQGKADVLRELLDVADNFDRALEHAGDKVPASFLEGMNLVARGLHDLLDRQSVVRIDAEGQPFDPVYHEALTSQPVEGVEPNTIVQVVQPGYAMNERVLRPAKVIVAAAPMPEPAETPRTEDAGGNE